jgi:hypothetical protein
MSLLHALEVLAEDPSEILKASPATAPLWFEVPPRALGRGAAGMLDERIAAVRELVGVEPTSSLEEPADAASDDS